MVRKFVFPLLAVCGAIFSVWLVFTSARPVPSAQPLVEPPQAPFQSFVAGSGIIEASTQNIAIATPTSGVIVEVPVVVGMKVKVGDPLLRLDERSLKAELAVRTTALQVRKERLERLQSLPRLEELPPAEARVKEAEATLNDLRNQLLRVEGLADGKTVSREEVDRRRFAVRIGETRLLQSQADLLLLKAGSWAPDIEVARAELREAEAQVRAIQTEIDRLIVSAPVDGEVLQVNVRVGEFALAGVLPTPLMLLGNVDLLHVRTDIDENDAWRIRPGAAAVAFVRGNKELSTPLEFVRIEPYIVPKRSLTGDTTERVDTRVLQILYRFSHGTLPVYVGQQMDVFIEASSIHAASDPTGSDS